MTLVSTEWLSKNHDKVKIIDASWHLVKNRNAIKEFENEHIENAVFFDLDKSSSKKKDLPHGHFLPTIEEHENNVSRMGISNSDQIIIYCNSDLISSCRAWFQFLYFGHDPKLVSVLNGGFKKWKIENRKVTNKKSQIIPSNYLAKENIQMAKTKLQINENIDKKKFTVLDARSKNRFLGLEPEPRPGIKSGSINGSKSLPLSEIVNTTDNTFLDKEKLKPIFDLAQVNKNAVVMSCGSSVSASTLALAYSLINDDYTAKIYIGSWTEYGKI
jgi:thiosulfate/3-mercaptopyruvate sulfurtransferase